MSQTASPFNEFQDRRNNGGLTFKSSLCAMIGWDLVIREALGDMSAVGSDENACTYTWLSYVRKALSNYSAKGLRDPMSVRLEMYKQRGSLESDFGDIAILVKGYQASSMLFEGVGFLEAKLASGPNRTFESFKKSQAGRISRNAPLAYYVGYDTSGAANCTDALASGGFDFEAVSQLHAINDLLNDTPPLLQSKKDKTFVEFSADQRAICVPIQHVMSRGAFARNSLQVGLPLAYQVCARYMRGFDLHEISPLRKRLNSSGWPPYLLSIAVSDGTAGGESVPLPPSPPEDSGYQPNERMQKNDGRELTL